MLKPLALQRAPSGCGTQQEPTSPHVGGGPDQIADPLKAEHRVKNVKGNCVYGMRRVGGAGSDERRHRARLRDALFENLPVFGLEVIKEGTFVDWLIELADVRINPVLAEERL